MEQQQQPPILPSFADFEAQQKKNPFGIHINPIRILSNILRYWYVLVISVFIGLAIAWSINRYTVKEYTSHAEIMIRETGEVSGAELLYSNALVDQYRNYYNEVYKIKSYPIIEQVVGNLNLNISFVNEGNIKDSEVYPNKPVNIEIISGQVQSCNFDFTLLDKNSFIISPIGDNLQLEGAKEKYQIGDTIKCNQMVFVVNPGDTDDLTLHIDKEYRLGIVPITVVASYYINALNVKWRAEGASLLDLSINGTMREKQVDFLNELVSVYSKADEEEKKTTSERSIEFIRQQMVLIADSLELIEGQLETFKNNNYILDLSFEAQRLFELLENANKTRSELIYRENYYNYLDGYVSNNQNLDQVILPEALGITEGVLTELVAKMVELQLRAKTINREMKGDSPFSGTLEAQVTDIRLNILESLKGLRQADNFALSQLNNDIKQVERQLKSLPGTERELISIRRSYSILEGIYVFLLEKLAEGRISQEGIVSDVLPLNPARSGGPIKPKPLQNYVTALLLGLFLPASMFAIREFFNNRVQSKDDITAVTDIPFLGAVGHNNLESNLIVKEKSRSAMAEGFRSLRSNLHYFVHKEGPRTFLVTSSVSGEGKTFTSMNLATVFAISGKKTLLIGADLRKPKIFDDFGLTNNIGLSNYLSQQATFEEIVQPTFVENLSIVSAGPVPPNPSELMLGPQLELFFEKAKDEFEVIIIDTPPVDILTDAFTLAQFADHSLFIVRQGFTPLSTVQKLKEISHKVKSISIVLNDIRNTRPGYGLGYGYSYGYGYGNYGAGKKDRYGYGNYYTET